MTTLSEQISSPVVKQGDYRELLAEMTDGSADLILTDPPYNISRQTGFASLGKQSVPRFAVNMDFGEWDHKPVDLDTLSESAYRVLRKGGTAVIFYDVWKLSYLADAMSRAGFVMQRLVIWEKANPVPLNMRSAYLSNSRETAVSAVKSGKPTFNRQYHNGVYVCPIPAGQREHPTQKPLNLFSELIRVHSLPGDLVVDPFLGSGTTGVAAVMNDRRFHGGDINSGYVQGALHRIRKAVEKPKQAALFD